MSDKTIVDELKINPFDYFNENHGQYVLEYFINRPLGKFTSPNSFSYTTIKKDMKTPQIVFEDGFFRCVMACDLEMEIGELYSPFRMLTEFKFKGRWRRAAAWVLYDLMGNETPYVRVGYKYFKTIIKRDRNNVVRTELKFWDKQTIVDDYGRDFFEKIPTYDDFTMDPDNKGFRQIVGSNYNLYAKFDHEPSSSCADKDIQWTMKLMNHVFGEQVELGLMYLKVLYDLPKQKLPILVLTSEERSTGKTTFLDYLELLFGANSVFINPQDIASSFNSTYGHSNVIMIEESRFDSVQATEKLKNLATQKKIMVNLKHVSQYSIPFHGKLIITSNDENKFSKVDDSEIRYWVRKVPTLTGKANHAILEDLRNEIPSFLAKLDSLSDIDTSRSRMVFEAAELTTDALTTVKKESRSSLHKDLELYLDSFAMENPGEESFRFIAKDVKDMWFKSNNKYEMSYINQVLSTEMKLPRDKMIRYTPLGSYGYGTKKKSGKPFIFVNPHYEKKGQGSFSVDV